MTGLRRGWEALAIVGLAMAVYRLCTGDVALAFVDAGIALGAFTVLVLPQEYVPLSTMLFGGALVALSGMLVFADQSPSVSAALIVFGVPIFLVGAYVREAGKPARLLR